jgi:UDP-glucose:(heptosyl)LPS alpha-1,3-glucosyltransferase
VLETAEYFSKKGHYIHLFATSCDPLAEPRIKFHKIPYFGINFLTKEACISFVHTINMLRWKKFFDICLAQPTRYFSPNVCEMQFVYREWTKFMVKNKLLKPTDLGSRVTPLIERHNLKKSKAIIAISKRVKNEVLKNYPNIPKDKVHVVYSGVNLKEFHPEYRKFYFEEIRKKHNISLNDIVILFVGNPFGRKGLEFAIKAFATLKSKNLTFLISGKDDPRPYQILAKKLGISDKIRFNIGLTSEIYKYFAASDIFLFPTLYEPFGLVILEAMASGLSVVTSKIAGAAELIEDGKDGLLLENPKNPKEIAEKLNYLLSNDALLKKIGKNARKKAEKHPWERTAEEMLKVFEEVAKK